jgi:hypothetical protein
MVQDVMVYLGAHPGVTSAMGVTAALAVVGLWYVLYHHLEAIIITLLTAAGIGSGLLVMYRGFDAGMTDLKAIGLFLVVIFPVIFWQAVKQLEPMEPDSRRSPRDMFSRKLR